MIRTSLVLLLSLLFAAPAEAAGTPYAQLSTQDKRDFVLHASVAYASSLTMALLLQKLGMKPGWAVFTSSLLVAGAAYGKEKYKDNVYSGSDMSGGMVGVGAAAITIAVLEF